ncbi:hypothetical protein DJ84_18385 [Halorubrum ezzemoulense]|nr:hypothetical protein DJ84_18385 [Halorubrum ezzemoulense]
MLQLRIERSDGTVVDELSVITGQYTRAFDEQARAELRLRRDVWLQVEDALDERNDRLFFVVNGTDEFGGRFDDSQANGGTVSIRLNSPEIDAADAEPTSENLTYQNVDPELVATDAVGSVPTLSQGAVSLPNTTVSYAVSFGSQSKILYDLRDQVGAEFRYNADFSVDVVDRLGANRSVTLGPAEGNIGDDFRKTIDEREDVTHVLGLGGESGPYQLTATAVADSYSGGREVWRRYKNKEIIDETRLQNIIDQQVAEYDGEPRSLTVEATVYDEDLELGDRVAVEYPEENISRQLRIVSLRKSFTERGRELLVTLSNRLLTRENRDSKRNDDLQRLNRGFGGFVDRDNFRAVERQPVTGDANATGEYDYPDDVVREDVAELTVRSIPYRAYSSGALQDSTDTETSDTHIWEQVEWQDGETKSVDLQIGSEWSNHPNIFYIQIGEAFNTASDPHGPDSNWQVQFVTSGLTEAGEAVEKNYSTVGRDDQGNFSLGYFVQEYDTLPYVYNDSDITVHVTNQTGHDFVDDGSTGTNIDEEVITIEVALFNPRHTHPPDPGVVEFDDETASNVDVIIEGDTVASNVGSGVFTETIDIGEQLTPGVNNIELASDSLGLISAYVQTELFRRGAES